MGEALEQAMKIEVMASYPGSLRIMRPTEDTNIVQLQGHISTLTDKIQELTLPRTSGPQVWCTGFYNEVHTMTECPRLRGAGLPPHPMAHPPVGASGGVLQVNATMPFHGPIQYHAFPNHQGGQD